MDILQQLNEHEDADNSSDPYYDVVTSKEHSGRLRLHGRCVTKRSMKEKGKEKMQGYTIPPEFLESIKADLVKQLTPSLTLPSEFLQKVKSELLKELTPNLTSMIVSNIQAANPGVQLNVPNFNLTPEDASSAKSCQPNGEPSAHNLSGGGQEQ